jgi:ubiquinone/menaquinone biosynthesis C-methylase UbiE
MSALGQKRTSHTVLSHRSVRNIGLSIKRTGPLAEELTYKDEAAAGYDRAVARVTTHFVPFLLRAAHVAPGMRVLDIATGTGLAAEAALRLVGTTGHVIAADLSPAMLEKARRRLGNAPNASLAVEDGQALSYSDESFDAVICSLSLGLFPDPSRGLAEFRRVLRSGGRAAVSVHTVPERSYISRINLAIARHVPSLTEAAARLFSLGDEAKLKSLFEVAEFRNVEITTETHRFVLPSFDAYFEPVEQGAASAGQALVSLPEETRRAVREEVRGDLGDTGGPIEIEVEYRFGSGRR